MEKRDCYLFTNEDDAYTFFAEVSEDGSRRNWVVTNPVEGMFFVIHYSNS